MERHIIMMPAHGMKRRQITYGRCECVISERQEHRLYKWDAHGPVQDVRSAADVE